MSFGFQKKCFVLLFFDKVEMIDQIGVCIVPKRDLIRVTNEQ